MDPGVNSELDSTDKARREFEKFLTYRRRMARMCAVQGLALYESWVMANKKQPVAHLAEKLKMPTKELAHLIGQEVIFIYAATSLEYKDHAERHKKAKKIDEDYLEEIIGNVLENLPLIDQTISKYLNNWTIDKLDLTIKSILRTAIAEIFYNIRTDIPILTSEYTNITSVFFEGKSIGFVNGIIDKIAKNVRK